MSSVINRRQMMTATGATAAMTGAAFAFPNYLGSQTTGNTAATSKQPLKFCRDIHEYTSDSLAVLSVRCYRGSAGIEHFQAAGRAMRLYAHHTESLKMNAPFKALAKKLDLDKVDATSVPGREVALARIRKFDSSVGDDIADNVPAADRTQLEQFKSFLSEGGIGAMYRFHAQVFESAAIALGERQTGQDTVAHSHIDHEAYSIHLTPAHIRQVCVAKPKESTRKHICRYLALGGQLATLASIFAKAGCAADVLGSVLFDIATEGGAIVLSSAEVALCDWIIANSDWMTKVATNVALVALGCAFA